MSDVEKQQGSVVSAQRSNNRRVRAGRGESWPDGGASGLGLEQRRGASGPGGRASGWRHGASGLDGGASWMAQRVGAERGRRSGTSGPSMRRRFGASGAAGRRGVPWRRKESENRTKGAHGDHGVVRDPEEEQLDGLFGVLCVDGTLVYAAAGDRTVSDRSHLYPGQLVVSASDPGGQVGIVMETTTTLYLVQLGTGNNGNEPVARGVSPADVRRVRELSVGDYVVFGPWLGRVQVVSLDVDVRFDDGAVCRVADADGKLGVGGENINQIFRPQMNSPYYPGLRVCPAADNLSVFESSRWLTGGWSSANDEGTVANVEMAAVRVDWVASVTIGTELDLVRASAPPAYQPNPRLLSRFGSGNGCHYGWGVADRCFFHRRTASNVDSISSSSSGDYEYDYQRIEQPMSVAHTRTSVDVVWQDGTRRRGVPSASLVPFDLLNDFEFFPGDRVVNKVEQLDNHDSPATTTDAADEAGVRFGVVRSFNLADKTVRVSWFKKAARHGEECDETVSAYDLELDHDHLIFYGHTVIRLQPAGDDNDTVPPEEARKVATDDLSWVGYVIGLCDDGRVQVKWGDNTTIKVQRHEITIVHNAADDEVQEGMNEDSDATDAVLPQEISAVGEQTISEMEEELGDWVSIDAVKEAQHDTDENHAAAATGNVTADNQGNGKAGTPALSGITQGLMRLAAEVRAKGKKFLVRDPEALERSEPAAMEKVVQQPNGKGSETIFVEEHVDSNVLAEEKSSANAHGDALFGFLQFQVVQMSPPDHYFLKDKEQGIGGGKNWMETVQKEWKILENNLPDTIYVRAFEDRMDLLRVAMVGAIGTPYQDGLFFFDLQLPPTYPAVPPQVHYRSFGLNLNSNLDQSGTVCLSLLDTFDGEGVELWSPEMSTILQVVVSIQGLVLTAQPFYNESVNDKYLGTPEAARNEVIHTEDTCLVTLRTMLHVLRRPPAGFEDLVRHHFRRRGRFVLRAGEAYLRKASPVGTLDEEANTTEMSRERTCSAGFRLSLNRFMPRLVEAFTGIGADGCDQFDKFLV